LGVIDDCIRIRDKPMKANILLHVLFPVFVI
jgi:hypothetical protein